MKNGAELLDRLVKDIVSESAASYVSMLHTPDSKKEEKEVTAEDTESLDAPTAFSLPRFIPLLQDRIIVLNPFTRTFLVNWITLLDSIPDLELVSYLPSFLAGLFKFLSDPNQDVHTATQVALERFLAEIKKIARVKRGLAESKKGAAADGVKSFSSSEKSVKSERSAKSVQSDNASGRAPSEGGNGDADVGSLYSGSIAPNDEESGSIEGDWIPGQDVQVDHSRILEIMVNFLSDPYGSFSCVCQSTMSLIVARRGNPADGSPMD